VRCGVRSSLSFGQRPSPDRRSFVVDIGIWNLDFGTVRRRRVIGTNTLTLALTLVGINVDYIYIGIECG
jgi:hypothetical protein